MFFDLFRSKHTQNLEINKHVFHNALKILRWREDLGEFGKCGVPQEKVFLRNMFDVKVRLELVVRVRVGIVFTVDYQKVVF